MNLMLHICCAPCSIFSWKYFLELGYDPLGYFFNPNIHPYREFSSRLESLRKLAKKEGWQIFTDERYLMEEFLRLAVSAGDERCRLCYELRLRETAQQARYQGIGSFSTTLLLSPYQNHELLKSVGDDVGLQARVNFVYADLRPGFRESMEQARGKELYRQKYCGCIFSEKERFYKPNDR